MMSRYIKSGDRIFVASVCFENVAKFSTLHTETSGLQNDKTYEFSQFIIYWYALLHGMLQTEQNHNNAW